MNLPPKIKFVDKPISNQMIFPVNNIPASINPVLIIFIPLILFSHITFFYLKYVIHFNLFLTYESFFKLKLLYIILMKHLFNYSV